MRKLYKYIIPFFIYCCLFFSITTNAQTVLVGPANGGDFEIAGSASLIANGWNNSLPATNRWHCNLFGFGNSTYSAYIRVNTGTTVHSYDNAVSSIGHFWRDINFPAGEADISLQFDWIGMGEPGFDRLRVFLVGTGTTPVAGTSLTAGQVGLAEYSNSNVWGTESIIIPSSWAGNTGRLVFSWESDNNTGTNPPTAIDNVIVTSAVTTTPVILMPVSGTSSLSTCSADFYDSGGPFNYGHNENSVLTICPSTAGTFININFLSFGLETRRDYLFIYDGPSTSDKLIAGYNGTSLPASVRASSDNPGGCLTFKFVSNGSTSNIGWSASISCEVTAGPPPVYTDNRDCYNASLVCTDAAISGNNTGPGMNELFTTWIPCATTGESEANWFYFRMATSGTVGMTIDPGPTVDYDFAMWGPYTNLQCPVNTFDNPIRCSYSQLFGTTGLNGTAGDVSEGVPGDKWLQNMNVIAGEIYVLYINNYSISSTAFNLSWEFTNGASLDCSSLPVQIVNLSGEKRGEGNLIQWETTSEENSSTFEVQRSLDALQFETIKTLKAAGQSMNIINYNYQDDDCGNNAYYYRLKETDMDGSSIFTDVIFVDSKNDVNIARIYPVPAKEVISVDIESRVEDEVLIEVINSIGNCIYSGHQDIDKGNNTIMINTGDLGIGLYFVRITNSQDSYRMQSAFVK